MRVIFLDIDGVLNCRTTTQQFNGFLGMDPYMILLFDRILQATGCKVVLSSSWRNHPESVAEIKKRVCKLEGMTPRSWFIQSLARSTYRGEEIKRWLELHPAVTEYAIIDDNSDMLEEQMSHFFKTSWEHGLTEEIANKIIEYFTLIL